MVNLTVGPSGKVVWNGYGYNMNDPAEEMEVVPLYVAWLKNPSTIPADVATYLARSWDTSGLGGLTGSDYSAILNRDPFANASYNPETDSTNRFQLMTGETFPFEPPPAGGQPVTKTYQLSTQTTNTNSQGAKDTYAVQYSIDTTFKGAFLADLTIDIQSSKTFTWVNQWSMTNTSTVGQTASLSITGPAYSDNYTGPTEIQVWRDNVYGSFMFYAVP
jgi:hypothetical protein